jgi:antitoxin HicB
MAPFPYRVLVEFSAEDEAYVARVPAFEGLAAHGATPEKATVEARKAAEGMMVSLQEHKRPMPAPDSAADYSGQLRLRLPRSVHARLSKLAADEDVSLNTLLLAIISEGLGSRISSSHAKGRR